MPQRQRGRPFFPRLFARRLSSSKDCFTGESPGIGHDGSRPSARWDDTLPSFSKKKSTMKYGGMLQVNLLCGLLLINFMSSSADPMLVCNHVK